MFFVRYVGFTFVPFALIILMYLVMIWKVRVEKLNSRRMLLVTFLVIFTGFIAWFPSIIANFGNINMNYEVSQIFTVTLFYLNSVSDPVIYILGYPCVKNYIQNLTRSGATRTNSRASIMLPGDSILTTRYNPGTHVARSDNDLRTVEQEPENINLTSFGGIQLKKVKKPDMSLRRSKSASKPRTVSDSSAKLTVSRTRSASVKKTKNPIDDLSKSSGTIIRRSVSATDVELKLARIKDCTVLQNSPIQGRLPLS